MSSSRSLEILFLSFCTLSAHSFFHKSANANEKQNQQEEIKPQQPFCIDTTYGVYPYYEIEDNNFSLCSMRFKGIRGLFDRFLFSPESIGGMQDPMMGITLVFYPEDLETPNDVE